MIERYAGLVRSAVHEEGIQDFGLTCVAGANDCCEKSAGKPILSGVQDVRLTLPHVDSYVSVVPINGLNHSCPITHSHVIYMIKEPNTINLLGAKNGIVLPGFD